MGNIEFYGIMDNYDEVANEDLSQVIIPEDAHIINNYLEINMENSLLFTLPLTIIILIIAIIKQIKLGILNKEIRKEIRNDNIEKYNLNDNKKIILFMLKTFFIIYISIFAFMCVISLIHEYLHAIPGAILGQNIKIAIGFPMGGITWFIEDMQKIPTLVFTLTPFIILGLIPAIISIVMKVNKKSYLKNWILALISSIMIISCGYDIVNSYNIIRYIPNNAYVGQTEELYYWYNK